MRARKEASIRSILLVIVFHQVELRGSAESPIQRHDAILFTDVGDARKVGALPLARRVHAGERVDKRNVPVIRFTQSRHHDRAGAGGLERLGIGKLRASSLELLADVVGEKRAAGDLVVSEVGETKSREDVMKRVIAPGGAVLHEVLILGENAVANLPNSCRGHFFIHSMT